MSWEETFLEVPEGLAGETPPEGDPPPVGSLDEEAPTAPVDPDLENPKIS